MSAAPNLMERKRREAADEIVRTAIALFARDGFDTTTVEAIAAEAGCSPRTFYRYFGSKEDVLFADVPSVIDRLVLGLEARLKSGQDEWEAVCDSVVEIAARLRGRDEDLALERQRLWLDEPALYDRYVRHVTMAERAVTETLARHRGTNAKNDDVAQTMAIAAIGAYRTTVTTHGRRKRTSALTDHLRRLLDAFGDGFAGRKG